MPVPSPTPLPQTGSGLQVPQTPSPATPKPIILNLQDWQAALAAYVVLLYVAEVDTLAPLAVAVAWGVAITTFLTGNVFKKLGA